MKLLSFFKLTYLLPSSIFLLISILISFFCSITFLDGYTSDKHIEQIGSKNDKKDWILISSIQELLFHRIQLVFDYLITSKLYSAISFTNFPGKKVNLRFLITLKG